jgi:outer membrane protein assembly factor BamB
MCAIFTRPVMKLFLFLALGGSTLSGAASTGVEQAGVESNFLIDGYRVRFAQADGSLTTLSLSSGDVLGRNRTRDFSGTLLSLPQGVLLLGSRSIVMLNPTNFTARWETPFHQDPNVAGDALVSQDGKGLVECRSLDDGRVRWSYELAAASTVVAESGKVLLHRDVTHDESKLPMIVVLDLESGKVLQRRIATNRVHWARTWFDGTNIFIEGGVFKTNRLDYRTERLAVWNTAGEETGVINIPIVMQRSVREGHIFDLDNKTFWKGRVYASRASIPVEQRGRPESVMGPTNGMSRAIETEHQLGGGEVLFERAMYVTSRTNAVSAFALQVELRDPTNRWTGVLSYLLDHGRIVSAAKAGGKILIGTDLGHVECVSADTGETQWLYYFPTLRRTVSSGAQAAPSMEAEAAAAFRRDNSQPPTSGLQVVGGKAVQPRIIADPEPADPYRRLPLKLALAWCGGGLPLLILILLHAVPASRRWEPASLGAVAVWLTFAVFSAYVFVGRVSFWSSMTLKAALGAGFAAGLFGVIQCFRRRQWIEGAIIVVIYAAVALFMAQALM